MNATPRTIKNAKATMSDAESLLREIADAIQQDGAGEHYPELAAMADEARAHVKALRHDRREL